MLVPKFVRRRSVRGVAILGGVLVIAGVLQVAQANPAESQNTLLIAWDSDRDPGLDPFDEAWRRATRVQLPLTAQAGAYAAGGGTIAAVSAQALHYEGTLYIRAEWEDSTEDASSARPELFSDALAVEFPAQSATSVPSICMGQADQAVNIWHWRADSQGDLQEIGTLFPNTQVDGSYNAQGVLEDYPQAEDPVFVPARALGNPFANPDLGPVQTLVGRAFGALAKLDGQQVNGQGVYRDGKWAVVLSRPFAATAEDEAKFAASTRTDMAFAVWNGSEGERDGQKSVSTFVTLSVAAAGAPGAEGNNARWLLLAAVLLIIGAGAGVGLSAYGARQGG